MTTALWKCGQSGRQPGRNNSVCVCRRPSAGLFHAVCSWMVYSLYCESAGQLAGKTVEAGKKLGSALIIILVLAALVFVMYFIVSRMWREISSLTRNMPAMYADLEQVMDDIGQNLNGLFQMLPAGIQNGWREMMGNLDQSIGNMMGNLSEPTVTAAGNVAKRIPTWLVSTIVTIISAYFFIAEREDLIVWAKKVAPDPLVHRMSMVMSNLKYAVGGYFKAQFKIMFVVYVLLVIGFAILNVRFLPAGIGHRIPGFPAVFRDRHRTDPMGGLSVDSRGLSDADRASDPLWSDPAGAPADTA